jgi:hypothetical protein
MITILNKLKSLAAAVMVLLCLAAITVSSCTTKDKATYDTEEGAEGTSVSNEEGSEGEEHPSDSTALEGEHPEGEEAEGEHPEGEDEDEEHPEAEEEQ